MVLMLMQQPIVRLYRLLPAVPAWGRGRGQDLDITSGSMRYTTALLSASDAASGPFVLAVKSLPLLAT